MKKKSKDKKPAQKKWILLLAAALFFICNSSVMWAKVQEHFFENSINDTLSATVMSSQAVITDSATAKTDEKAVEKTDKERIAELEAMNAELSTTVDSILTDVLPTLMGA